MVLKQDCQSLSFVNPPIDKWKETTPVKYKHELHVIMKQQNNKPYTKQYVIDNITTKFI